MFIKGQSIINTFRSWAVVLILSGWSASGLYAQVDTDFWFVVPELSHRGNTSGHPGRLRIATLELEATVSITMPANPYHATLNPTGCPGNNCGRTGQFGCRGGSYPPA